MDGNYMRSGCMVRIHPKYFVWGFAILLILANAGASFAFDAEAAMNAPVFTNDADGGYAFDTGLLRGKIMPGAKTLGLTSVVHIPSGIKLDGSHGILSYYRFFTKNKRYGHAGWDWPCESKVAWPQGDVQIFWPANEEHPFEINATYQWVDNQTLDIETSIKAHEYLEDFEVFLASYCSESLPAPYVYVGKNPDEQDKTGFMSAKKIYGDWQMFTRDDKVLSMIKDGRWTKEPNPVNWVEMPRLAAPICYRRNGTGGPVVILMSPPKDCFAISTPYEGEGHYSLYLSLFGRDIPPEKVDKVRCRMVIATEISDNQIVELYKKYMAELSENGYLP